MESMDKGLTVPKLVLIVWPKIPQMPQNLSAQFVCPSPKVLDFNEKRLHWVSVVCVDMHNCTTMNKTVTTQINIQRRPHGIIKFSESLIVETMVTLLALAYSPHPILK